MKSSGQKTIIPLILITLACFGPLCGLQAVVPAPDGCYPNFTTAEGCDALNLLTTGAGNTGLGWRSLFSDTAGSFNTAVGAGALVLNNADSNTAVGAAALLLNTPGIENTAIGTAALLFNDSGALNTAVGAFTLFSNTTGSSNSAFGFNALQSNISSFGSSAFGHAALSNNDSSGAGLANGNSAFGEEALLDNVDGHSNSAFGFQALHSHLDGFGNSAFGDSALNSNVSGNLNTAIGDAAGALIAGSGNVCIGANVLANAADNNLTRIKNIGSNPIVGGVNVVITGTNSNGDLPLGYASSSSRYKENIKPINKASERLFALRPVSFQAKGDAAHIRHYGLIAEDVAKVDPELAVYNPQGQPETLRFDSINGMLLNEFLKEHNAFVEAQRKVEQQQNEIDVLKAELKEQRALIEKVSERVDLNRSTSQVVANNQ
jgi:hypothetical protein